MYTSASGNNVTVSPRDGQGHSLPPVDDTQKIEYLSGTGVANGMMTANIKCSSTCEIDSGIYANEMPGTSCGSFADYSSSSGSWIWAAKSGSAINSDDVGVSFQQHSNQGNAQFDFNSAKGGSAANPFTAAGSTGGSATRCGSGSASGSSTTGTATTGGTTASGTSSGGPPAWVTSRFGTNVPTGNPFGNYGRRQAQEDESCDSGSSSANLGNNGALAGGSSSSSQTILVAHGVLACLAFAILFPLGGIMIRLLSFRGLLFAHAGVQILAYLLFIVAAGLGISMAVGSPYVSRPQYRQPFVFFC